VREVFFVIGRGGAVLWSDAGDSAAALPDTRERWDAIWRLRGEIEELAHSHPGGTAFPSAADARSLWRGCLHLIAGLQREHTLLAAWWHGAGGLLPLPIAEQP